MLMRGERDKKWPDWAKWDVDNAKPCRMATFLHRHPGTVLFIYNEGSLQDYISLFAVWCSLVGVISHRLNQKPGSYERKPVLALLS